MQADAMEVDQDRSRRWAGSGRVSWGRGANSGPRSPYHRPTYRPPSPTPKGNINARWGHELFDESSDIYSPRLAKPVARPQSSAPAPTSTFEPSPSLRPFGAKVEPSIMHELQTAPQLVVNNVANSTLPPAPSSAPPLIAAGRPLAERLSIKGTALSSSRPVTSVVLRQQQRDTLGASLVVGPSGVVALPPSPSEARDQKIIQAKARDAYLKALKDWELSPAILDIEHLADGTSVDDVRTAFSEHGTILGCEVMPGNVYQGQATLNAQITYSNRTSATRARDQFDGVIADGLQLIARLKPNPKPKLETFVKAEEDRANSSMEIEVLSAPLPPVQTPSLSGKMRSDQIPQDPRNSPQYTQFVSPLIAVESVAKPGASSAVSIAARISGGPTQSLKERLGNSRQNSSGSLLSRLK